MLDSLSWGDDQGDTRERSQCSDAVGSIQFPQLLSFMFPTVVGFYGVGPYQSSEDSWTQSMLYAGWHCIARASLNLCSLGYPKTKQPGWHGKF